MRIPNLSMPTQRNTNDTYNFNKLLPQGCFDECMAEIYRIPQCKAAFASKDAAEIAACLLNFGMNVPTWMVAMNIGQCGAQCIFGEEQVG